ncbi:potassium/proton antiporter [Porphyromonas catoniae]|jgi:sodium/hydrogen antiporter|uniref:Potassium/proton antiporter n=1 Tax=Porphyromonas catoniae F0037 TaxID=1127696 RepID=L1NB46_9PORP|nr:potassium/proton antiporter [Porphyromonas catoniae]EKY00598.1 potassium/proton antiporter [Porphyromonas catoniae F0037]
MEHAPLAYEPILLVGSILMLAGIMAGKVGTRFGVPALLLFLITGMIFGSSGLGIQYNDAGHTQFVGMIALTVILFFGGLETKFIEIRPILGPGITLSTLGVLLTTVSFGGFLYGMDQLGFAPVHFTFPIALLLAATMSSTDSASVFALLRSKNMHLKEGLRPILELESGSNDPMAYMLTIALIQYVTGGSEGSIGSILLTFLLQFSVGGLLGYAMGWLTVKFLNKANIGNEALYPILLLCAVFLTFSATTLLQGNGYLAVYIMGVVVGNKKVIHKKSIVTFFDGLTWLLQIALFIILGLFVDAHNLLPIAGFALLAGLFMIFVARPLAVHLCLVFFPSISMRGRWFLSWVGLRGAVPIIFATYPLMSQVEGAETLFNIVFFITLLSLLIQGSTMPAVARLLKLDEEAKNEVSLFGVEIPQHTGAQMVEREVTNEMLSDGRLLMEIDLREEELVILVRRGDNYMVPKGKLALEVGDILLIVFEQHTKK